MFKMISQAKNAIEAYNQALEATSSNIANMNVTGYKRVDVSFQSIFERVLNQGTAAHGDTGGTNPKQTGQGMALSSIAIDFSAGDIVAGATIDLAVSGQGMFVVSPDGGNSYLYTKAGNFEIDASGNLTSNGMQVYGLNGAGSLVAISSLPSGNKSDFSWRADGTLLYNGTSAGYQIALTYFPNPGGLAQAQGTTFAETAASGSPATYQAPGGVVGTVLSGQREQSNVFYLNETIEALELQRAMNGNLTIIQMASELISNFINKLS